MAKVAVISGNISPGEHYIVAATSGAITYNATSYTSDQIIIPVTGIKTFTASGDAVVYQLLRFKASTIDFGLTSEDKIYSFEKLLFKSSTIDYGLNSEDKIFPEKLRFRASVIEYSPLDHSKIINRK